MSRPAAPPPVCDGPGCGKQKQEANHWWSAGIGDPFIFVLICGTDDAELLADMTYLKSERVMNLKPYDFCGQTCLFKFLSEQMGKVRGENDAK